MIGGQSMQAQGRELARKPHVVIATPGRLAALLQADPDLATGFKNIKFLVSRVGMAGWVGGHAVADVACKHQGEHGWVGGWACWGVHAACVLCYRTSYTLSYTLSYTRTSVLIITTALSHYT